MKWFRKKTITQEMLDRVNTLVQLSNTCHALSETAKLRRLDVKALMVSQIDEINEQIEALLQLKQKLTEDVAQIELQMHEGGCCECACEEEFKE